MVYFQQIFILNRDIIKSVPYSIYDLDAHGF